jgi:L-lactate dehydrogenase complex protein LldG
MTLDTSKARDSILQRIRANQRRPAAKTSGQAEIDAYLAQHMAGPRPGRPADLVQHFRAMAERMASTVEEVATIADAPAAAVNYLVGLELAPRAVIWPSIAQLPWAAAGLEVEARAPRRDESHGADLVGITGAFCALAETGTLVLMSGADTPASTHLLPETHVALVSASRIVADMEDAFKLMREELGGAAALPRAINMVSGPSRTGDIEQTIVLGAHGPYRVHIIVIRD